MFMFVGYQGSYAYICHLIWILSQSKKMITIDRYWLTIDENVKGTYYDIWKQKNIPNRRKMPNRRNDEGKNVGINIAWLIWYF